LDFTIENYYEWNSSTDLILGFFANKLLRLILNLIGLTLILKFNALSHKSTLLVSSFTFLLLVIYFTSFFKLLPVELSKLLNPILFSPLLVIGTFAYKLAEIQNIEK
jgi:hypothetical protein